MHTATRGVLVRRSAYDSSDATPLSTPLATLRVK
jgi:hypothetical protein